MKAHLVKGSAAAKAYMAKLRSKKTKVGAVKKKAVKKAAPKKKAVKKAVAKSLHKDTKSHNVNIRVVSGIEGNIYKTRELIEYDLKNAINHLSKWKSGEYTTKNIAEKKRMITHNNKIIKGLKLALKMQNKLINDLLK